MKTVTAYICDFCPRKKRFAASVTAKKHEAQCFYNPVRRACATCVHYSYEKPIYESETGYSEGGNFCAKDMLNVLTEEVTTELRSECDGWELRAQREGS
jgi:hypothetical protein